MTGVQTCALPICITIKWRDEEGEKVGYVGWAVIEREIGALILTGAYHHEQRQTVEEITDKDSSIGQDDDREDWNFIGHEKKSDDELDEFSIPDELDEMQ